MDETQRFRTALLRRIDILIGLQLDTAPPDGAATSKKIHRLLAAGASASEIASIVNKPLNYVTAVVAIRKHRPARNVPRKR